MDVEEYKKHMAFVGKPLPQVLVYEGISDDGSIVSESHTELCIRMKTASGYGWVCSDPTCPSLIERISRKDD